MKKGYLLLFLLLSYVWGMAQSIENVKFRQTDDDKVVVTFDLISQDGTSYDVKLLVSDDGGKNFYIVPRTVTGDVGPDVSAGRNKEIFWDVLSDIRRLEGEHYVVKVMAKSEGNFVFSGIEFVHIPAGTFQMGDIFRNGDPDEKPLHMVKLSDFYLGRTEVTVEQFSRFVEATHYVTDAEKQGWANTYDGLSMVQTNGVNWRNPGFLQNSNHPVVMLSWNDANAFCKWAECRLPTEAEWEYAARDGGHPIKYSWGNGNPVGRIGGNVADKTAQRMFSNLFIFMDYSDGYTYTAPVGSYSANELGLYDMTGNVWEWCQDWYDSGYYKKSPSENPQGPSTGSYHILRGGSWINEAWDSRISLRRGVNPLNLDCTTGMRVVKLEN